MILNGIDASRKIKEELKIKVDKLDKKPLLVVIQVIGDEASNIYIKSKEKSAIEVGFDFEHYTFNQSDKEEDIIIKIKELNERNDVNGIIVQLPLPKIFNSQKIINTIDEVKDVDGLTIRNQGYLYSGEELMIPCTPKGILYLLDYYKVDVVSKNVVVVGKSNLVGKPISLLLLNKGATTTICNSQTKDIKKFTKEADIVISATGNKHLITKDMVKENSWVIDVGITRVDGKIYGDVDYEDISSIANVTKTPGGVGPMTVAMLLENTMLSYELMNKREF